jgi:hypothetical protein
MDEDNKQRFCRKCLLRDMVENAYTQNMEEYVKNLDQDIRVEADIYESRLETCKECDLLTDGLCRGCGCFVEMIAAMKKNRCPYDKW